MQTIDKLKRNRGSCYLYKYRVKMSQIQTRDRHLSLCHNMHSEHTCIQFCILYTYVYDETKYVMSMCGDGEIFISITRNVNQYNPTISNHQRGNSIKQI